MSVEIKITLQEREADALIRAEGGRGGWNSEPSQVLQVADFKIVSAIHRTRATATARQGDKP